MARRRTTRYALTLVATAHALRSNLKLVNGKLTLSAAPVVPRANSAEKATSADAHHTPTPRTRPLHARAHSTHPPLDAGHIQKITY